MKLINKAHFFKLLVLGGLFLFIAFGQIHDYYISVTEIEYIEDSKLIKINSRFFGNDLDDAIRTKYNKALKFDNPEGSIQYNRDLIESYLKDKITFKINDKKIDPVLVKIVFKNDIVECFFEINHVKSIGSLEISNKALLELITEQQNIIKTNIYSKHRNFTLTSNKDICYINYE